MDFLPKTNVLGFRMTNNFCVQSFWSRHTKMGEKFEFRSVSDINVWISKFQILKHDLISK